MGRPRPDHLLRRRRLLATLAGLAVVALVAVVFALVVPGPTHRARSATAPRTTLPPPRSAPAPTTTTTTLPVPLRGLATATSSVDLDDRSRPLVRDGITLADHRDLPTTLWYPVAGGRHPLVVFVHGYDVGPSTYARFCATLASSGYVVAAPSFPLEDPARGNGLDRSDLPNEAGDVSYVISALEGGPEAAMLTPGAVAVAGHSDGADVSLMVGYQRGLVDPRVRAVVSDAPDPMTGAVQPSDRPLLLVQGSADDIVPYSASGQVLRQVDAPRWYVTLLGATHLPPIAGGTPWTPVLDGAVADFLDATVAGRSPLGSLDASLSASPLVRLEVAGTGGAPAG